MVRRQLHQCADVHPDAAPDRSMKQLLQWPGMLPLQPLQAHQQRLTLCDYDPDQSGDLKCERLRLIQPLLQWRQLHQVFWLLKNWGYIQRVLCPCWFPLIMNFRHYTKAVFFKQKLTASRRSTLLSSCFISQ